MTKNVITDLFSYQIDELNCEKLVKSVYNLNDLEFETYCTILMHGAQTVTEIRDHLNNKSQFVSSPKDRTMVSRALKQLYLKGLVFRRSETKDLLRGYYHVYIAKNLQEISSEVNKHIDEWYDKAKTELASIVDNFNAKKERELLITNN